MTRIVVLGSFNVDLVTYVHQLPSPGETVMGQEFSAGPGGKGSNQAVAAANLGAEVYFIGRVGQDNLSDTGYKLWREAGVNTDFVVRDSAKPTGVATILVERYNEHMIVVAPGANLALSRADIDKAEDIIASADVLLTQFELNLDVVVYALKMAHQHGVLTILNPAPAPAPAFQLPADLLANVDILTPNAVELEILRESAQLPVNTKQALIVTHGRRGIHWIKGTTDSMVPSFPVEIVDSIGAGDAFNGALAVAVAEGMGMENALRFANATAAICLTRRGAALSMPTRNEVEAFLSAGV